MLANSKESQYTSVLSGVLQESVLHGPIIYSFFKIYIDDLAQHVMIVFLAQLPLSHGGQVVLYADDLLLFFPIQSQEDCHYLKDDIVMMGVL